ncbi:D-hexose-6-phosphate mutarotase [Luteolibacter sp. Populi]|uniref:D-hexose-6-phosphate mutarotase n=1 Tax=Luteolibacter sp. Populi TaxID=3230487 RepID=UPI00346572D7
MIRVTTSEPAPGYEVYEVEHPLCRGRVARHGAQVMEWAPTGSGPVLYCSPRTLLQEGKAIRGGIPICWPWFANHPHDAAMPAHGFARSRFWEYDGSASDEEGVRLRFHLEDDPSTMALWPHRFRLETEISLGERLGVRLTAINTGESPFPMGGALHSYFTIGSLAGTRISGLETAAYFDKTGGGEQAAANAPLVLSGEVDRIYRNVGPVQVCDSGLGRTLMIGSRGHGSTVVWNPGVKKAAGMADLPAGDYEHFAAVEAALPPGQEVVLAPGERHVMETWVGVCS